MPDGADAEERVMPGTVTATGVMATGVTAITSRSHSRRLLLRR